MSAPDATAATPRQRLPRQIAFIIGNEGCERFSFYGMKNILVAFMVEYMLLSQGDAKSNYHLFVSACYFFPLLGGWLADRFWDKYRTILWLSILYSLGNASLAIFQTRPWGFYGGLFLIALGSGGIKPCVSAFVGDQFDETNKGQARRVFAMFYWIINFGSFFASIAIPKTLKWWGPGVAFGIPGVLMAIATLILWIGRKRYIHVPPVGRSASGLVAVLRSAFRARSMKGEAGAAGGWLDRARGEHPAEAIESVRAVGRVLWLFAPVPFFWALYDQKASAWVLQAKRMDRVVLGSELEPSQMLALNPLLVMLLIPLLTGVVYPALARRGRPLEALGRMKAGMFLAVLAFLSVAAIERVLASGAQLSVLWQAAPYTLLTLGEVLLATTGLEFAYSQAPVEMKSTLMSLWNITVTVGNLITAQVSKLNVFQGAGEPLFYAGVMLVAAFAFSRLAAGYVPVDRFRARA